jgi:hypothetical protein
VSPGGCLPARVREPYFALGCANSRVGNGRSSINLSALDLPVAKILGLVLPGLANGQVAGQRHGSPLSGWPRHDPQLCRIEPDRERARVHQFHVHVRPEAATFDRHPSGGKALAERLVQTLAEFRACGPNE